MILLGAVYLSAVSPGEIKANEHNFVSGSARTQLAEAGVDKLVVASVQAHMGNFGLEIEG